MEIVTDIYREDIAAKLEKIGRKLQDEMLADQAERVATKQADFVTEAVRLGLMLEAKFAAICAAREAAGLEKSPKRKGLDTRVQAINETPVPESFPDYCERVFGAGSERNMRRYRWLGRRYLQAATEPLHPQSGELAKCLQGTEGFDAEGTLLGVASGGKGGLTLRTWVAGRSISQLIRDLRRVEADAEDEEVAEQKRGVLKAEADAAHAELTEGEPDSAGSDDAVWKQMNLPLELRATKAEISRSFERLEAASGVAPQGVLRKLWTDYRNALAAKVRAAEAKLALLKD